MSRLIHVAYRNYCPEFDEYRTISVELVEAQFLGMDTKCYDKRDFSCSDKTTCQYLA